MSNYRNMYTRQFKAPTMHKGKFVVNKTMGSYDFAGPGFDSAPTYNSTGDVIRAWMKVDPANRTIIGLKNVCALYAKRRGIKATVSYNMIREYLNGHYTPKYATESIPVAKFKKWLTKNAQFLANTKLKKYQFEVKDGCVIVPIFDANGEREIEYYEWRCCNPKKLNGELLASAMGMQYHESAGYGKKVTDFKVNSKGQPEDPAA